MFIKKYCKYGITKRYFIHLASKKTIVLFKIINIYIEHEILVVFFYQVKTNKSFFSYPKNDFSDFFPTLRRFPSPRNLTSGLPGRPDMLMFLMYLCYFFFNGSFEDMDNFYVFICGSI